MSTVIKNRLEELGITLPKAQKPKVAKIKGWSIVGQNMMKIPALNVTCRMLRRYMSR